MNKISGLLISLCLAGIGSIAIAAGLGDNTAKNLADDSIYHIDSNWLDQERNTINIAALQGKLQVIAFVYTYCEHSCPFILANLKKIARGLPQNATKALQFTLISLDPARDTPEVLKKYMEEHDLYAPTWQMLSGDEDDVLELAALIGVRYKPMDNQARDISHSNMITLLDKQGRIVYQLKGLNQDFDGMLELIALEP
ncbi:MAG: protein SCO1/2 [Gammaproteobacteria bacterium]